MKQGVIYTIKPFSYCAISLSFWTFWWRNSDRNQS